MAALESKLRRDLERAIVEARNIVVAGVKAKLQELTVHEGKKGAHLSETDASLRTRLRAHGRQIGDRRNSQTGSQTIDRLTQECAYEQWHRMIFVRFLAENDLLIEPELNVAVSMEGLRELAEESGDDPWEMGAKFAAEALPAIFRLDDPLLQLKLSRETRMQLESVLDSLPAEVFTADDSLGWVYQFWQSEEKDRVNQEGEKITGQTLPAVTQLFTEHYMVLFLLHNTLGAWHAGKVLADNPQLAENAQDEAELRRAVALTTGGGYEFEYLRFVREPISRNAPDSDPFSLHALAGFETDGEAPEPAAGVDGSHDGLGPWRPMGGTYPGWPKSTSELKVLDPSCGSGHFLVAALELLVRLRMHEEGLNIRDAVTAVIRDNLFGLEIDQRCTQIAAFNVAMAAWKLTGPRPLPPMHNIACSGIPLGISRDDWMKSLKESLPGSNLGFQWGQLYDMFSNADTLGSLINPQRFFGPSNLSDEQWETLSKGLASKVATDPNASSEDRELAAAAQGLVRASELLAGRYTLVVTNVPYLGRGKQDKVLKEYLETQYALGKADLATAFVLRCLEFCEKGGSTALVTPQNWLFLTTYKKLRETLLDRRQWDFVARLGPGAFETIGGEVVNVALLCLTADHNSLGHQMTGIDVSVAKQPEEKSARLCGRLNSEVFVILQEDQANNPDARILFESQGDLSLLSDFARCYQGVKTGDNDRVCCRFWEVMTYGSRWRLMQSSPNQTKNFDGLTDVIDWSDDGGLMSRLQGLEAIGIKGVGVGGVSSLPATFFLGHHYDSAIIPVLPKKEEYFAPIAAYCFSPQYREDVRKVDQKVAVTTSTALKVPFDLKHWKKVAAEKYRNGLPEPESDDPTQWLFHGRPEESTAPLQVAVARLLGYRWPAELDSKMRLSQRASALVARCIELNEFVDDDGIVCIPSVRGEDPAADRLLRLLNACKPQRDNGGADTSAYGSQFGDLDKYLRDSFFQEHCELFHQRPFIWHIWDGRKDGFSALVNYHKLAGPHGQKLLESLTYSYLGEWINRQESAVKANESGADARLIAAKELQQRLIAILAGQPPYDIFVRWKPLHEQPIGWTPDINDGVRMNIRPFMAVDLSGGRKGAGILRFPPKIKWTKDRGKEPKRPIGEYPWFWSWDEKTPDFTAGDKFTGDRWNDLHYTIKVKQAARSASKERSE